MPGLECCCAREDCGYVTQNQEAFRDLENDVETAAHVGQALLTRHEYYVSEAEACRNNLTDRMTHLERLNTSLLSENDRIKQENEQLVAQLEDTNQDTILADAKIDALNTTLIAIRAENMKLSALAARADELEAQLMQVEIANAGLREDVGQCHEDERFAVDRWMGTERRLKAMEEEMIKVEQESNLEREKHVETVGRMERTRLAEKELYRQTGPLQGAAATYLSGPSKSSSGTGVVSHFVRDIMEENANLQAGMNELRELLMSSNDEIQSLREQVISPHSPGLTPRQSLGSDPATSLRDEIERCRPRSPPPPSQEVHVHHHYHRPRAVKKDKERVPVLRRPPRRRALMPAFSNSSFREAASPSRDVERQGSASMSKRWSGQSSSTDHSSFSSQSGSPYSQYRASSIFDRIDTEFESSRPTSPDTAGYPSPAMRAKAWKTSPDFAPDEELTDDPEKLDQISELPTNTRKKSSSKLQSFAPQAAIGVSASNVLSPPLTVPRGTLPAIAPKTLTDTEGMDLAITSPLTGESDEFYFERQRLRRTSSQDSLVSLSGMDIHLAQQTPKTPLRLLSSKASASSLRSRSQAYESQNQFGQPLLSPSRQPLTTIAEVHASYTTNTDPSRKALHRLSPTSILTTVSGGGVSNGPKSASLAPSNRGTGIGRFMGVGSWVRGRWGVASMASTPDLRQQASIQETIPPVPPLPAMFRGAGINQSGPILGLRAPQRAKAEVVVRELDGEALKDALAG